MAYFIIQLTLGLSQGGFCYHSTKFPPFGDSKLSIGTESTLATLEQLPTFSLTGITEESGDPYAELPVCVISRVQLVARVTGGGIVAPVSQCGTRRSRLSLSVPSGDFKKVRRSCVDLRIVPRTTLSPRELTVGGEQSEV